MDLQNTESPIVNFRRLVRKAVRNDARAYKKLKLRTTRRVIAKMVNIWVIYLWEMSSSNLHILVLRNTIKLSIIPALDK